MAWLLGVLLYLAAYLFIGFRFVAPMYITREIAKDIRQYPRLAEDLETLERWRTFAAGSSIGVALIWPLYLGTRLVVGRLGAAAPLTEHELKLKTQQQAQRIAELERELGLRKESSR